MSEDNNNKRNNELLNLDSESKKVKGEEEVQIAIPFKNGEQEEPLDQFELPNYYLASAIESLDEGDKQTLDLLKVTVNESNALLHKYHQTQPEKFTADFYLPLVISLYYLGVMDCEEDKLKKEFFDASIEKLEIGLSKCKNDDNNILLLEYLLINIKIHFQLFSLSMKSFEIDSSTQVEKSELKSIKEKFNFIIDLLNEYYLKLQLYFNEDAPLGKFSDLILEPVEAVDSLVELVANFNEPNLNYQWLDATLKIYDSIAKIKNASVLGAKGKASNLVHLANLYFDYCEDDSDSDSDNDDEEDQAKLDISKDQAIKYLNLAVDSAKVGLKGMVELEMNDISIEAQFHVTLGEAYLNLGNLAQDDEQEKVWYEKSVESFETGKKIDSELELPETFESFLEAFQKQLKA